MSEVPGVAERLQQAAAFMQTNNIEAVFVQGDLDDGRPYEGISFMGPDGEFGEVRFAEGKTVSGDLPEIERRLGVRGFINNVVRPVERAACVVYGEGSDLLDERFDSLPGMA